MRPAVEDGLRLQVEHLSEKSDSFSLPAWRKWARMTTDTRNKKGWPTVFADGRGVGSLRASIYTNAAHGAHLRGLYADFLDEAAELLGRDALRDAAAAWREAAARWDPIVDTALPPGDELRELIDAGAAARWDLQRRRDEAVEQPPAVRRAGDGDVRGRDGRARAVKCRCSVNGLALALARRFVVPPWERVLPLGSGERPAGHRTGVPGP